jgi:putative endopeptidase
MKFWRLRAFTALGMAPLALLALGAAAPADEVTAPDAQALHLDWLDRTVSPSVDFYRFANGGWQAQNPVPPEYGRWGTFDVLRRHTQEVVRGILEHAAADQAAAPGSIEQKIGDFYASGMDEDAIEAAGITPLAGELGCVDVTEREDLAVEIAHLHAIGVGVAFDFGQMPDFEDSKHAMAVAYQGGLGLPDRAYYLEPGFASIRDQYVAHVARMLQLGGASATDATAAAAAILALEERLATASLSRAEQRDPRAMYHPMTLQAITELTPSFSWPAYFGAVGRADIERINVAAPAFFDALDRAFSDVPISTLRAYLRYHLLATYAPYLSRPFQDESFRLRSLLTGAAEMQPRWQRVQDAADSVLGFAVGQKYVEAAFSPAAKERAIALLHGVRAALADDLATISWMSPATREAALEKLGQMEERIGYPDRWRDYEGYVVDRGPWALVVLRGKAFDFRREVGKIGKEVDRSEWDMTPQTVNAYYDPSLNSISFPAAILQAPFFDPEAPAAVNQGGIGFVMGHEITHGFDDEGAQFDGKGNLRNWWTEGDLQRFQALTACVADHFSSFTVEGVPLDGKLVVGEATADLGGLSLTYRAFRAAGGAEGATIAGFTPEQQLFLAGAHIWAFNVRPEEARLRATTDPHPPPRYRVNGTFSDTPAFAEAFSIPEGSPMVRSEPCKIW